MCVYLVLCFVLCMCGSCACLAGTRVRLVETWVFAVLGSRFNHVAIIESRESHQLSLPLQHPADMNDDANGRQYDWHAAPSQ